MLTFGHIRVARKAALSVSLMTAVGLVAAAVFALSAALAGPTTPTPSILTGPTGPTASRTANFTYTDTKAGASFKCSLDGGSFNVCATSGVTYTALADGSHTFRVEAQAPGSSVSQAASRGWSVDTTPPQAVISFPANNGSYNLGGWNAGCTPAGICGTATDATGVHGVKVSLLQASSGKYWNGSGFTVIPETFNSTTLTTPNAASTPWKYLLALPTDGIYTIHVQAADTLGNAQTGTTYAATATFTIDTLPPPAPVMTGHPDNPTFDSHVEFHFTNTEANDGFRCQLDSGAITACTGDPDADGDLFVGPGCLLSSCSAGEAEYENVAPGDHCFQVVAVDAAGNLSPMTSFCWTIAIKSGFTISGDASALMYPGVTQTVNLVFTNPNNFDLKVLSVTITVQSGTTKVGNPNPGCVGTQNLVVARPFTGPAVVPKNSTKSLSDLHVPTAQWPVVQMPNLPFSQDACQDTTFHMTYTGTATKP